MRAYNTEVPIMAYAVYPRARTHALEELIQILLENGGEKRNTAVFREVHLSRSTTTKIHFLFHFIMIYS